MLWTRSPYNRIAEIPLGVSDIDRRDRGQLVLAYAEGTHDFLKQDCARRDRTLHTPTLVVQSSSAISTSSAPSFQRKQVRNWFVDADAVLPVMGTLQCFQQQSCLRILRPSDASIVVFAACEATFGLRASISLLAASFAAFRDVDLRKFLASAKGRTCSNQH